MQCLPPVDGGKPCGGASFQELVVANFGPSMVVVTCVTVLAFMVGSLISYFIITGTQPVTLSMITNLRVIT